MLANYAATDPVFYGTHRSDYGVSGDKDMANTPLYIAIAQELRRLESYSVLPVRTGGVVELRQEIREEERKETAEAPELVEAGVSGESEAVVSTLPAEQDEVQLSVPIVPIPLVNESVLLGPISSICAAAHHLHTHDDVETTEFARIILADASRLVQELKRLNIVSPVAYDPGATYLAERSDEPENTLLNSSQAVAAPAHNTRD
jgi:hypothetical protein